MIYELKDDDELRQIREYWREEMESDTELWRKIAPKANKFVVKSFRTVGDAPDLSRPLPYNLVEASAAIDLWSLGALIFLLIMGETLVPSNRDDDCVDETAMATLCGWTDETTRERLGKVDNIAARDLLSHLLVVAPAQRLAYSLDDALNHVFFDPDNADKQRELEKASFLDRVNARPPNPFQQQDFERLWQSSGQEMRDELLDALLKMLDEWGLARPGETAEIDAAAGKDTTTMHDKKDYLERFVFPLSPWKIEEDVTLPADAQPKQDCTVTIGGHEVVITVPKDKEGGSVIKQPVLLRRLQNYDCASQEPDGAARHVPLSRRADA